MIDGWSLVNCHRILCLWTSNLSLQSSVSLATSSDWDPWGFRFMGKHRQRNHPTFFGVGNGAFGDYGSHQYIKCRMVPEIGASQCRRTKGHCTGKSFQHVVFTVVWLGEQHGDWPSLKFVGVFNKAELKSTFVLAQALKRRQKGAGWERGREREILSRRQEVEGRSCERLTLAQLSSYISISEGIVEESAGEQRSWISTDWQNQGLMLSGEGKKKKSSYCSTQPELLLKMNDLPFFLLVSCPSSSSPLSCQRKNAFLCIRRYFCCFKQKRKHNSLAKDKFFRSHHAKWCQTPWLKCVCVCVYGLWPK